MGRSPASFQKRQREVARRERQQLKAERRLQRKNEPQSAEPDDTSIVREEAIPEQPGLAES